VCQLAARERHHAEYSRRPRRDRLDYVFHLTPGPGLRYNRSRTEGRGPIPFPSHARSADEAELLQTQRRRRDGRDGERTTPNRRARRRRQSTPWLQRNALSVAAGSVLVAFLGLGFGLLQMLNRPESSPALLSLGQTETPATTSSTSAALLSAASIGPSVPVAVPAAVLVPSGDTPRSISASARVLDPNYTIAAGDTLVQIALRFNTTVDRVQAFNSLSDPRALRIGTKLVIPPPL
jgi:LysM repeat protein